MSFERPLALLLVVAIPVLWWLLRSRRDARVVRVASLLAFREAPSASPSSTPRPTFDWRLLLLAAASAGLALAASGPRWGGGGSPTFRVVLDDSASMGAGTCDAVERARQLLSEAAPSSVAEVQVLRRSAVASIPVAQFGTDGAGFVDRTRADDLPGSLAAAIERAHEEGFPGIVLVTDARVTKVPGIAVIGPSRGARTNLAIVAASLDGDDAVISLRNFGATDVDARVGDGAAVRDVRVPARGVATAHLPAPRPRTRATYAIVSPQDDLAVDDRRTVARPRGPLRVRLEADSAPHLASALRAAAAEIVARGEAADVAVVRGPLDAETRGEIPTLVFAPVSRHGLPQDVEIRLAPGEPEQVRGSEIVARGDFGAILPAPGTLLGVTGRIEPSPGLDPLWSDGRGTIAAAQNGLVLVTADPEDVRSDWHRDASFPALVAAALERLAGGADELVDEDAVPVSESDVVHEPPATATLDEIRGTLRSNGRGAATDLDAWFAGSATALLAIAAFAMRAV